MPSLWRWAQSRRERKSLWRRWEDCARNCASIRYWGYRIFPLDFQAVQLSMRHFTQWQCKMGLAQGSSILPPRIWWNPGMHIMHWWIWMQIVKGLSKNMQPQTQSQLLWPQHLTIWHCRRQLRRGWRKKRIQSRQDWWWQKNRYRLSTNIWFRRLIMWERALKKALYFCRSF